MLCAQRLHRSDSDDRWAFTSSLELVGVALRAFPEAALGFQLGRGLSATCHQRRNSIATAKGLKSDKKAPKRAIFTSNRPQK